MNKDTTLILISVLSTPLLGALVSNYFARGKNQAEAHNLNITGEITIGESWQKYAHQQQLDKEELRKEFTDKINSLKDDHKREIDVMKLEFSRIAIAKDERIATLEGKVYELETEVAKYKTTEHTIDTATNAIHTAVDVAAEQIKHDTK